MPARSSKRAQQLQAEAAAARSGRYPPGDTRIDGKRYRRWSCSLPGCDTFGYVEWQYDSYGEVDKAKTDRACGNALWLHHDSQCEVYRERFGVAEVVARVEAIEAALAEPVTDADRRKHGAA